MQQEALAAHGVVPCFAGCVLFGYVAGGGIALFPQEGHGRPGNIYDAARYLRLPSGTWGGALFLVPHVPGACRSAPETRISLGVVDEASAFDLKTVISELVTIDVAFGATQPIEICVEVVSGVVEGFVAAQGTGARVIARARESGDDSLVLRIVDSLVDEWSPRFGKQIWFRKTVRPPDPQ